MPLGHCIVYDAAGISELVLAFLAPALRKVREGQGTHFIAAAGKVKSWATRPALARSKPGPRRSQSWATRPGGSRAIMRE